MITKHWYAHHESGVAWESLLPFEIEAADMGVEEISAEVYSNFKQSGELECTDLSETMLMFQKFYNDPDAWEMYITGPAGSGKSYNMREMVEVCVALNFHYQICAHTHKACGVLREYMPNALICTLHSFLKKRPTINEAAEHMAHLSYSAQFGSPDVPALLFIDELGVVGEKDLMDIRALQDPAYEGAPTAKVIWLGDPNQTRPVKDVQAVIPCKPYWIKLTKVHRTSTLLEPLQQLIDFINGKKPEPLKTSEYFIRDCPDLVQAYKDCAEEDKVFLAYTNERVQEINFDVMERDFPEEGDMLFSPTVNKTFLFRRSIDSKDVRVVDQYWDSPLTLNSKYKTLEFMIDRELCNFFEVVDEEGDVKIFPVIFGTYNGKVAKEKAGESATAANAKIVQTHRVQNAAQWSKVNPTDQLARKRAEAWRTFLTIDQSILCMDFNHAMTVHKSQGSSYKVVFLDTQNLSICAERDYDNYLRLFYTGMSRSRLYVITN